MRKFIGLALLVGSLLPRIAPAATATFDYNADLRIEEGAVNLLLKREMVGYYPIVIPQTTGGDFGVRIARLGVDFQSNQMVLDISAYVYGKNGTWDEVIVKYDRQIPISISYVTLEMDQTKGKVFARIDGALSRLERFVTAQSMAHFCLPERAEEAALRVETEFKNIFKKIIMTQVRSDVGAANKFLVTSKVKLEDYPIFLSNGRISAMMNDAFTVNVKYRIDVEDPTVTSQYDNATKTHTLLGNCKFTILSTWVPANGWFSGGYPMKYLTGIESHWDAARNAYVIENDMEWEVWTYYREMAFMGKFKNYFSYPGSPRLDDLQGTSTTISMYVAVGGARKGPFNFIVKL